MPACENERLEDYWSVNCSRGEREDTHRGGMFISWKKMAIWMLLTSILGALFAVPSADGQGADSPILQSVSAQYVLEGEKLTVNLTASDPNGDEIAIGVVSGPSGATFEDNGDGTGIFEWTPDFSGPNSSEGSPFLMQFWVSDGVSTGTMSMEVIVINKNRNPYIVSPDTVVAQSGQELSFETFGYDPDYDAVEWQVIACPDGFQFSPENPGSAFWPTTYADSGYHTAVIELADLHGAADTAAVVMQVLQTVVFSLTIDTVAAFPGELVDVGVSLMNLESISGLNLLINYDVSVLAFASLTPAGTRVENWEYFSYNLNYRGFNGDIRINGIADLDNGIETGPLEPGDGTVAEFTFLISSNLDFTGFSVPLNFVFRDILTDDDNTLTDSAGERIDQDQITYGNGFVRIKSTPQSSLGDINLNGISFEIGDAVYFINYFIDPVHYPLTALQLLNSDVNRDGYGATIADLVYLINVLISFNHSGGKLRVVPEEVVLSIDRSDDNLRLLYDSEIELGGMAVILECPEAVDADIRATSDLEKAGLQLKFSVDGNLVRIVVYSEDGHRMPAGINELFRIDNNLEFDIKEIQLSSADGFLIKSMRNADLTLPGQFRLYQNYPNPFNPTTEMRFSLPRAVHVTLNVYNILGQEIISLVDGVLNAGEHSVVWDGLDASGRPVASGIYFYRLESDDFTDKKKMILLK